MDRGRTARYQVTSWQLEFQGMQEHVMPPRERQKHAGSCRWHNTAVQSLSAEDFEKNTDGR